MDPLQDRVGDTFRWRGEYVSTLKAESVISTLLDVKSLERREKLAWHLLAVTAIAVMSLTYSLTTMCPDCATSADVYI